MKMSLIQTQGYFYPYDSTDELYTDKKQPEFGLIPSLWQFSLPQWRFFHAKSRDSVPLDFASPNFDDSSWQAIHVPSVWQQEGFGYPSELMYEKSTVQTKKKQGKITSKLADIAAGESEDDVGVYRLWVSLPKQYIERVVYLVLEGVASRFEVYMNNHLIAESKSQFATSKCLLSGEITEGKNLLTILVYRFDKTKQGRISRPTGMFGFSGLFRPPYIVAEPRSIEITAARLTTSWLTANYSQEVAPKTAMVSSLYAPNVADSSREREMEILSFADIRKDGGIKLDLDVVNHEDRDIDVVVECRLMETRTEYDLYNLPEHRIAFRKPMEETIPKQSVYTISGEIFAKMVLPWTDQTPHLYDLVVEVKSKDGKTFSVKKKRFGFRTTDIFEKHIHINNEPMQLNAVKYYEFDPDGGSTVPLERFRQDILLMKRANINAIFVMHHPSDAHFFDLCDEYGMYVISQSSAATLLQSVYSLMHHPSIIMWAMAGKKYDEEAYLKVKKKVLSLDDSRPIYCKMDRKLTVSDIMPFPNEVGYIYGEWCDLCLHRAHLRQLLKEDKTLFESMIARPKRAEDDMDICYIHQGDLVDYGEHIGAPIAQGIVDCNRVPHPIFFEVKKQCETVKIFASQENPAILSIQNVHPFGATSALELHWQLLIGGQRLIGGSGPIPSIPALSNQTMQFDFRVTDFISSKWGETYPNAKSIYDQAFVKELLFDIRLTLQKDSFYAPAGHEIAFYQQVLLENVADPSMPSDDFLSVDALMTPIIESYSDNAIALQVDKAKISFSTVPSMLFVTANNLTYGFSRKDGGLCSIKSEGMEYLASSMKPSFFRAATNIDRSDKSYVLSSTVFSKETDWRTIEDELEYVNSQYEVINETFSMLVHYKSFAMRGQILVEYQITADGKLSATLAFTPKYDLVRYGFRVQSNPTNYVAWYGRGDGESYVDRKESQRIGWYTSLTSKLYHEYARPAESGGHTDTKLLLLRQEGAQSIKILAPQQESFSFSVLPYSPEMLDDCQHPELLKADDGDHLFVDFFMKVIERTDNPIAKRGLEKDIEYKAEMTISPA